MDSQDSAHLALLARPELGITFTKLHCWTLTDFSKCVFLDADTLVRLLKSDKSSYFDDEIFFKKLVGRSFETVTSFSTGKNCRPLPMPDGPTVSIRAFLFTHLPWRLIVNWLISPSNREALTVIGVEKKMWFLIIQLFSFDLRQEVIRVYSILTFPIGPLKIWVVGCLSSTTWPHRPSIPIAQHTNSQFFNHKKTNDRDNCSFVLFVQIRRRCSHCSFHRLAETVAGVRGLCFPNASGSRARRFLVGHIRQSRSALLVHRHGRLTSPFSVLTCLTSPPTRYSFRLNLPTTVCWPIFDHKPSEQIARTGSRPELSRCPTSSQRRPRSIRCHSIHHECPKSFTSTSSVRF